MKIRNNIELKKSLLVSVVLIIIFLAFLLIANCLEYLEYTKNYNNKLNAIMSNILSNYPEVDKNDLMKILNTSQKNNENLLYEYGIDIEKDSAILENNKVLSLFVVVNVCILLVLALALLLIFLKYNHQKNKKIEEITRYIEEINNRNYKLYIEDNTEDELSILKNEIYKTTVMLKEVAENSKKDKINLKDSISDISHQLKTPLTSMIIMLDNILDNSNMDQSMRNEFLKDVKREIININFLVNSLLKLSKLDANSINFVDKSENISDLVAESVKNVSTLCDLKNVKVNIIGDKNSKIKCDLKWQIEAITNILKNCVEHSNINSLIDIYYEQNQMYSKIEIKDYGVGIDEKDLPHIFERFYKGKNSASESVGIGLALAKSIIEKNNGYISVESKLNQGTIFTIKYFE